MGELYEGNKKPRLATGWAMFCQEIDQYNQTALLFPEGSCIAFSLPSSPKTVASGFPKHLIHHSLSPIVKPLKNIFRIKIINKESSDLVGQSRLAQSQS